MIRRERRDGGEGEERGLRKGAERGQDIDTCLCLLFSFLKTLRFS